MSHDFSQQRFERLKAELQKAANPPSGSQVDAAFDRMIDSRSIEHARLVQGGNARDVTPEALEKLGPATGRSDPKAISGEADGATFVNQRHSVGYLGEDQRERYVQSHDELSVSDKLGIKKLTKHGVDGATIGLDENREMILNFDDNKAYAREGAVNTASAIQQNLDKNVKELVAEWRAHVADPTRDPIEREIAQVSLDLVAASRTRIRITNGGGNLNATNIPDADFHNVNPSSAEPEGPVYVFDRKPRSAPPPAESPPEPPQQTVAPANPQLIGAPPPQPPIPGSQAGPLAPPAQTLGPGGAPLHTPPGGSPGFKP